MAAAQKDNERHGLGSPFVPLMKLEEAAVQKHYTQSVSDLAFVPLTKKGDL